MATRYRIEIEHVNKVGTWDSFYESYSTEEKANIRMIRCRELFQGNKFRVVPMKGE